MCDSGRVHTWPAGCSCTDPACTHPSHVSKLPVRLAAPSQTAHPLPPCTLHICECQTPPPTPPPPHTHVMPRVALLLLQYLVQKRRAALAEAMAGGLDAAAAVAQANAHAAPKRRPQRSKVLVDLARAGAKGHLGGWGQRGKKLG